MKKVFVFMLVLLLFSGCSINEDTTPGESETIATEPTIATEKPSDSFENVAIINHKMSRFFAGYDHYDANKAVEKILNLINQRDKNALIAEFSKGTKNCEDLDRQVDVLFDYINEPIVDYTEVEPGVAEDVSYGETVRKSFRISIEAYTDSMKYYFDFEIVQIDKANENNVGIKSMCVFAEEVNQYYLDNYDVNDFPSREVTSGLVCFSKEGIIN